MSMPHESLSWREAVYEAVNNETPEGIRLYYIGGRDLLNQWYLRLEANEYIELVQSSLFFNDINDNFASVEKGAY